MTRVPEVWLGSTRGTPSNAHRGPRRGAAAAPIKAKETEARRAGAPPAAPTRKWAGTAGWEGSRSQFLTITWVASRMEDAN